MIKLPEHVVTVIRYLGIMAIILMWITVITVALYRSLRGQKTEPGEYGTSWHRDVAPDDLEPLPVNSDVSSDD